MSSTLVDIAQAVVTALNQNEGFTFTAVRSYRPGVELKDLKQLRVTVVPKSLAVEPATRGASSFDCALDVGVQRKLDSSDEAEVDALMLQTQAILEFLRDLRPCGSMFVGVENEPVFDPGHLEEQRVFTSLLTVTYRVRR